MRRIDRCKNLRPTKNTDLKNPASEIRKTPDTTSKIWPLLKNLLSNAIKYSRKDSDILINIEQRKKVVNISVKDFGIGIPKNDRKRIFERFYRIEKSRSKKKGGTGLGLAIVKHIIEGHKTKIKLKSKVKQGSKFSFNLKLAPNRKRNKKSLKKILRKKEVESV